MKQNNLEIARILSQLALYLDMDEVPFKPQAYGRAAQALQAFGEDVRALHEREGRKGLDGIPGVGKGIADKIEEHLNTGKIKEYEAYKKKLPVNLGELTSVEGVGPKMVKELYQKLKVKNLKDLERAAKERKIRKLPGFAEKTEQNILQGIAFVKKSEGRWLLGDIYPFAEEYVERLKDSGLAKEALSAGSVRRMKETIGDIDILVTAKKPEKVMEFFLRMVPHEKVWGRGKTKTSVRSLEGFDVDIRVVEEKVFGAALQYFTGSAEHNVKVRTLAVKNGYKLSEYGLFKGKKLIACATEKDVYRALGMSCPEPELREDQGEVEAALEGKLPKVLSYDSLKGDLQVQTNWTDGAHSIEEMAKEARKQGLQYIAITDHTWSLAMTGGANEAKLLRQMAYIDKVKKKISGITILKGAEVDIHKDGTLDISDRILSNLDVVGVSVHSLFKMPKRDMTRRILRAISNPYVDILFHPTGRLLGRREAYDVDMDKVIAKAKKTGTLLEANASPARLDLKDVYIRKAVEAGAKLVIDSDAHHKDHFQVLKYGIAQARRGWAREKDVVNTLPLKEFQKQLKS